MLLASVIRSQVSTFEDLKVRQCIEMVINPASVIPPHKLKDSDCSPIQCSAIDCNVRSVTSGYDGFSPSTFKISIDNKQGQ